MAEDTRDPKSREPDKPRGQDVTAGRGRRDEVGPTGIYPSSGPYPEGETPIVTPADINAPHDRTGPGVKQSDELRSAERLPRKGNEADELNPDRPGD
ncbi:MAG: hypothetical protein HY657_12160 [Acidobacteria bacterium]|nr:hypothetical protein [Acidobacteriota bacterium]